MQKIAARFNLSEDTIVWNNDDIFVNRLLPGDKLTILPENGILYKTAGEETIQSIADKYKVSPYAIIDSEYNRLQNASPSTLLPSNQQVIVPGGTSSQKARYWNPGITKRPAQAVSGGSGASSNAAGEIAFGGGSGSCGYQPNVGGSGSLRIPLPGNYTVIRGFFPGHSGIDLAAPIGTTVFAADGGTVIFAGWSSWGYGNSVVLAHGGMLTLYGHMSRINASCGQRVSAGQPIGAVGSTGNSSGPHLHFEIRPGGGEPVNPTGYMGF
ncbi:MAG: M23 family metallopeptidase [Anaerolineae bacterium]|nr:M23 family metallopeptidase [Anaerolineae bacterium]